jgi:Fur family transcriptional regulator, peroxide stress response regulator
MVERRTTRLIDQLRHWGVRVTAQRLAVAEVLMDSSDHPTAQDVYDRVQARFPHITMGTVYNTINTLAGKGLLQPLPFPDGARYDINASPHVNLVCLRCGSIEDVIGGQEALAALHSRIAKDARF